MNVMRGAAAFGQYLSDGIESVIMKVDNLAKTTVPSQIDGVQMKIIAGTTCNLDDSVVSAVIPNGIEVIE